MRSGTELDIINGEAVAQRVEDGNLRLASAVGHGFGWLWVDGGVSLWLWYGGRLLATGWVSRLLVSWW